MSWVALRQNLYTLLDNNKVTLGVHEVHKHPKLNFGGYPSIHISPEENEAAYETTTENERTYAFSVRIFQTNKIEGLNVNREDTLSDAIDILDPVADAVIDLLDQEDRTTGASLIIDNDLPARYTFLNIFAVPSRWGLTDDEELVFNEMSVRIRVSVDVN